MHPVCVQTDHDQLRQTLKTVAFHTLGINLLVVMAAYWVQHKLHWTFRVGIDELPSLPRLLVEIVVFILCQEVFFYYSHR